VRRRSLPFWHVFTEARSVEDAGCFHACICPVSALGKGCEYREDVWHRRKPCRGAAKISCALSLSEKRVKAGLASLEIEPSYWASSYWPNKRWLKIAGLAERACPWLWMPSAVDARRRPIERRMPTLPFALVRGKFLLQERRGTYG
jgi:hypothetical protein